MSLKSFILPMTFAVVLAATPAFAQHGGGGHMGGGGGHSGGHFGGGHGGGGGHHGGGQGHGGDHGQSRPGGGFDRHDGFNHGGFNHGGFGHGGFGHHGGFGGPFVHVRPIRPFHGPFFAFRPRFNLGFGLFLGWPVDYPWGYFAPYPYPYGSFPYDDPYDDAAAEVGPDTYDQSQQSATNDNSSAAPDANRNVGGISLNITPGDATVWIDGQNAGSVSDYSPSSAPLTLAPGRHHVVVEKPGYQTMTFDADVTQGQVLPYQGTMQPVQ
jgi:hypothetical protein